VQTLFPALQRLRFIFEAIEPVRLPGYSGSAWRGLLGRGLRESACVTREPRCEGCLLIRHCSYSIFFESPPTDPQVAARYNALPHPYVLEPDIDAPRSVEPGEPLTLGINLIGPAISLVPYLIHALKRAGELGLGRRGGRFALNELQQEAGLGSNAWEPVYTRAGGELRRPPPRPAALPPAPATVSMRLETPLRIKHQGRFVGPAQLTAPHLLRALSSRLAILSDAYGPVPGQLDSDSVALASRQVELIDKDLRWHEWTRYSSRQDTAMQMGGLLGQLSLAGDGLQTLWPLLWFGQWALVGKGTSFGLGRYRID
jgi:hypothetical protein